VRRRRTRYTWFPVLGTDFEDPDRTLAGFPFNIGAPTTEGLGPVFLTPLIADNQQEIATTNNDNLVDFVGSDYFLKRIVGKIYAFASGNAGSPPTVNFGAGIFIARKDSTNNDTPLGSSAGTEADVNFGVLDAANMREPWIWRRTWQLRVGGATADFAGGGLQSTYQAGSVLDGPHVDARTARRVRNDERLWLSLQAATVLIDGATDPANIDGWVDLRFLGALRKSKNRSAF